MVGREQEIKNLSRLYDRNKAEGDMSFFVIILAPPC